MMRAEVQLKVATLGVPRDLGVRLEDGPSSPDRDAHGIACECRIRDCDHRASPRALLCDYRGGSVHGEATDLVPSLAAGNEGQPTQLVMANRVARHPALRELWPPR